MRLFIVLTAVLSFAFRLTAEVPKIAVIPAMDDKRCETFADLLTAEFSKAPDKCALVERAQLQKLASESSLQSLSAAEKPLALARLAKADGLVFVSADNSDPKKPLLSVRLSGCSNGLVHRALVLAADDKDPITPAHLAADVLVFPASRLASAGEKESEITVSLLGLRSVSGPNDPQAITLNTALAWQLSCQPGLVVTERWKLDDVIFERSLGTETPPKLTTGAVSLEGSFEKKNYKLTAKLHIQGSSLDEIIESEATDPQTLAENLAKAATLKLKGKPLTKLDSAEEAKRFAALGFWLMGRRLGVEAVQAYESAIALGDSSAETQFQRLQAYAFMICPGKDRMNSLTPARSNIDNALKNASSEDLHRALETMIRIASLATPLIEKGWKGFEKDLPDRDNRRLSTQAVLALGIEILDALHRRKEHLKYADEARYLRGQLREINVKGTVQFPELTVECPEMGFIYETPADAIAFYRERLAAKHLTTDIDSHGQWLRNDLWNSCSYPVYVLHDRTWVKSIQKTERAIDWSKQENTEGRRAWKAFCDELCASPDLLKQLDGFSLSMQSAENEKEQSVLLERYLSLCEANIDQLATPQGQICLWTFQASSIFRGIENWALYGGALARCMDLVSDVSEKATWMETPLLDVAWDVALYAQPNTGRKYDRPDLKHAERFLASINRFAAQSPSDPRWKAKENQRAKKRIQDIRDYLAKAYPELFPVAERPPVEGAAPIRAWQPAGFSSVSQVSEAPAEWLNSSNIRWDGRDLLIALNGPKIVILDPITFKQKTLSLPGNCWRMQTCGDFLMIWTGEGLFIANYRQEPVQWKKVELPNIQPKPSLGWDIIVWKGSFYVVSWLGNPIEHPQHWIGRYENGALNWIVSSNRVPAQHAFDAKRPRSMINFLPGKGGKQLLLAGTALNLGNGSQLFDFDSGDLIVNLSSDIQKTGDRILLWSALPDGKFLQVMEVSEQLEKPRLLIRNPSSEGGYCGFWEEWAKVKPVLDYNRCQMSGSFIAPVGHGGKLWFLKWEKGTGEVLQDINRNPNDFRLVGLDLETKATVVVPLRYDVPEALRGIRGPYKLDMSQPNIYPLSLTDTPEALFFAPDSSGFWVHGPAPALLYIRWDDVNAWISKNQPGFLKSEG